MAQQPRGPGRGDESQGEFAPPPTPSEPLDGFESPQPPKETEGQDIDPDLLALKDELEKNCSRRGTVAS